MNDLIAPSLCQVRPTVEKRLPGGVVERRRLSAWLPEPFRQLTGFAAGRSKPGWT